MTRIGAVLRVSGSKAGVTRFLAKTQWDLLSVYWKGVPRYKSSTSVSRINGFNVNVSDVEGMDLPKQIRDAARFLVRHDSELRRLRKERLNAVLDFGVEVHDASGPAYFRFPKRLIDLLAKHAIELEVSYYGERA